MKRIPVTFWFAVLLAAANFGWIVGDAALAERSAAWLQFDHSAVADGQLWRLVTCHFAHWSAAHFWIDVLPWLAMGLVFERQIGRRLWTVAAAAGMVAIGLGVWLALPDLAAYRGWSGLDNTAVVPAGLAAWRAQHRTSARMALLALALLYLAKLSAELLTGAATFSLPFDAEMGSAVPLAHWLGAAAGLACWATSRIIRFYRDLSDWLPAAG